MAHKLYSRSARRRAAPSSSSAPDMRVMWALIAVNVVVFVLWNSGAAPLGLMRDHFLVSSSSVLARPWTLLTYALSHRDTTHLLFNMMGLWVFGQSLLWERGARDFLALLGVSAVTGALAHVMTTSTPALGASAAVTAVSVVFALTHPHRQLLVMFFIPAPAWLAVGGFVLLDVVGLIRPPDGIAHGAHLGGALAGAFAWWWWRRPR